MAAVILNISAQCFYFFSQLIRPMTFQCSSNSKNQQQCLEMKTLIGSAPAGCRHRVLTWRVLSSMVNPHLHRSEIRPSSRISCRPCSWVPSGCICQRESKTGSEADSTQNVQIWLHSPDVTHGVDLLPQVWIPFILKLSVTQISSVSTGFFWRKSGEKSTENSKVFASQWFKINQNVA